MSPAVVKVGSLFRLYYVAERTVSPGVFQTKILRCTAPVSDPTNFTPRGIALKFPSTVLSSPGPGDSSEGFYNNGPYHPSILPRLTADGSAPAKDANGDFLPWYMYLGTRDGSTAVAISTDGGDTFALVAGKNPLFPFEVITVAGVQRRTGVPSKSKPYDVGGAGATCAILDTSGKINLFYTAVGATNLTLDDLGAVSSEVGHASGSIPDIGIAYAESTDGVTFTRRTADALGVTSPSARSGRLIDPRRRGNPNGLMEYIVSRPMVFQDGSVWRMPVSVHSTTYRARSLHSTDLINWTWDPSPATGFLGLGGTGSFDEFAAAYPCMLRDGNTYHCWYTGNHYGHISAGVTGIGYATASAL